LQDGEHLELLFLWQVQAKMKGLGEIKITLLSTFHLLAELYSNHDKP